MIASAILIYFLYDHIVIGNDFNISFSLLLNPVLLYIL